MFVARCGSARSSFRTRKRAASAGGVRDAPTIVIVVPFRDQPEQDRRAQLAKLQKHIAAFLSSADDDQQGGGGAPIHFLVVVAEQTHDGCAFNRGALLNAGFLEAQKAIKTGRFASVILHDVDLLPSPGLLSWYRKAPQDGQPVHIAGPSTWRKYGMMGEYSDIFFGGVTALSPSFAAANGYQQLLGLGHGGRPAPHARAREWGLPTACYAHQLVPGPTRTSIGSRCSTTSTRPMPSRRTRPSSTL